MAPTREDALYWECSWPGPLCQGTAGARRRSNFPGARVQQSSMSTEESVVPALAAVHTKSVYQSEHLTISIDTLEGYDSEGIPSSV